MPLDARRVQAIFLAAVQHHDADERRAILVRECPDDLELRQRVEALLGAHDRMGDFLNEPLVISADDSPTPISQPDDPGPHRDAN